MALPVTLPGLSDREAITDCIYRAINAFDLGDVEMLDSSLFPDATFGVASHLMHGMEQIRSQSFDFVSRLDTTHHPGNVRVLCVPGESKAKVHCSFLAYHWRKGDGMKEGTSRYTTGGYYHVDVERDGALWKARKFLVDVVWTDGDAGVMARE
ncbi:hypothetical protein B0A50_04209 [Salinomyces thailandicus]|uniref:SnoaL-like domain-containing protein n=1 Tax=Salinomyces thailandicus TaxID=706561 RepID=A0A4U0U0E8_9PEZI|nr:hypothetical protein B0A50_04209 [Salinomyces thailandica]